MKFIGTQTVYPCREHEEVSVPFRLLLNEDGSLNLYPELAGKGYFDIDYRQGQLLLKARGFVGLIPISDRVAIHVSPRAPIANLLYMIWRSGTRLPTLEGFVRSYQQNPGQVQDVEEVYVSAFVNSLRRMKDAGVLKRYCQFDSTVDKRGRLLLGPTISRFRSRGICHNHVFRINDLTVNNRENQILKFTLVRLFRHFASEPTGPNKAVAIDLRELLTLLDGVQCENITPEIVSRETIGLIRRLPNSHRFYEPALWLSFLIATKSGVAMEKVGSARFESVIIDAADVFENYLRTLCHEAATSHFPQMKVLDGNKRPVPLFLKSSKYNTQPDFYFQRRQGANVALADAKYKPKLSTEDRHAIVTFCEALQVRRCCFICPRFENEDFTEIHGTTPGGTEISILRIDLSSSDMPLEEERFKQSIATVLRLGVIADRATA